MKCALNIVYLKDRDQIKQVYVVASLYLLLLKEGKSLVDTRDQKYDWWCLDGALGVGYGYGLIKMISDFIEEYEA